MSQQTKNVLDYSIKGFAVITLTVIAFFLVRFVNNSEITRESVIRMEVDLNNFKDQVDRRDRVVDYRLQDLKQDIQNIKR